MERKIILITGSTDGIGFKTAEILAAKGHKVIVHGRSEEKTKRAAEKISETPGNAGVEYITGDFASFNDVRRMAEEFNKRFDRLDVLLNNAGIYMGERKLTEDGHETTFQVNHLAPFLLTHLLMPVLQKSAPSRIVNVASQAHLRAAPDIENVEGENYDGYSAYALSKLGNIIFTFKLAEELKDKNITVNTLHPGVINTKLLRAGFGGGGAGLEEGAETSVYLAESDEVNGVSGKYFVRKQEKEPASVSNDRELQEKFWQISLKKTGIEKFNC